MPKKSLFIRYKIHVAVLLVLGFLIFSQGFNRNVNSLDPSVYSYYEFGKYGYTQYQDIVEYEKEEKCREISPDKQPALVLRVATLPVCQWSPDDPGRGSTEQCGRELQAVGEKNIEARTAKENFENYGLEDDSYVKVIRNFNRQTLFEKKGSEIPKFFAGVVWLNNYPNPPDKLGYGFVFGLSGYAGGDVEEGEICTYRYRINFATSSKQAPLPPPSCSTNFVCGEWQSCINNLQESVCRNQCGDISRQYRRCEIMFEPPPETPDLPKPPQQENVQLKNIFSIVAFLLLIAGAWYMFSRKGKKLR